MEHKPYSGNGKPFIYAMYAPEDQAGAESVLFALHQRGFEVWPSLRFEKRRLGKSALVLLFLSATAVENEAINRAMQYAVQTDHSLLVVHLAPTALTPTQRLLLNTQQAILQYDCASETAFYEKLFGAQPLQNLQVTPAQKRLANLTTWGFIAGVLCAVAVAVFLTLGFNAPVPEDSLLSELGYQGRMADITSIYLYGDQISKERSDMSFVGLTFDWKKRTHDEGVFYNHMNNFANYGSIEDISDFAQLKNLTELSIAGNRVSDIYELYQLRYLVYLDLTGNPVKDISGIGALSNLQTLCIGSTQIVDLTPLDACKSLLQVNVDEKQYMAFSKLKTAHRFKLVAIGPMEEMDRLDFHIFGGPEESGGDYNIFMQTRSWNLYDTYSFEFFKNDRQIKITGKEPSSSMEDGHLDKLHIYINQAQFGAYDTTAVYRLIVHFGEYSATYQVWHKFDPARANKSASELISTSGF
jgi:hypothetical protein